MASVENIQLQDKRINNTREPEESPEVDENESKEKGEDVTIRKPGTKRGLAFLKRKWTFPEILTTCGFMFEVFGFVSMFYWSSKMNMIHVREQHVFGVRV